MSDDWNFYPCQMGDTAAFIFYDHGIRQTIDRTAASQLLKVWVTFKHPRPDGLYLTEEFEQLRGLEDELKNALDEHSDIYVGRITVGGHRYFHIFTPRPKDDWASVLQIVGEHHGYKLEFVLTPDVAHDGYWRDLFPSDDDWQVIKDMRVLEALMKHGDDGTASRRIDHWAYFRVQHAADQFSQWARGQGYSMNATEPPDDGTIRVRFAHEGTLRLPDITSHTIALRRKAQELGGDYDGWETPVCEASS